ncbi:MAG TPA: 6-phosphogluconolactonase [Blastocatellia bacterium]
MELTNNQRELVVCKDAAVLSHKAAEHFVTSALNSVSSHGRFSVALSGGSTPRAMFSVLAEEPLRGQVPWASTFVFWSDERTVPPDNPDSNYKMAYDSLISQVPLPPENIHRMRGEADPNQAADEYQTELRQFFGPGLPRFDLVLLGMGDDGHTASLFPGTAALAITDRLVAANYVPRMNTNRLTFTFATINAAAAVGFLVQGKSKAKILKEVLENRHRPEPLPSQLIAPTNGELLWMTDRDAVSQLNLASQLGNADIEVLQLPA